MKFIKLAVALALCGSCWTGHTSTSTASWDAYFHTMCQESVEALAMANLDAPDTAVCDAGPDLVARESCRAAAFSVKVDELAHAAYWVALYCWEPDL